MTLHSVIASPAQRGEAISLLQYFIPELILTAFILAAIIINLARKDWVWSTHLVSLAGLALSGLALIPLWKEGATAHIFSGMVAVDPLSTFFKLLFVGSAILVLVASSRNRELEGQPRGEFDVLLLGVTLGMMLLAGARNLLMIYLSLEMVSMLSYCLAGYLRWNRRSAEASLKYVLYGAVASGIMIFGMSILYGLAGSLDLGHILAWVESGPAGPQEGALFLSVVLILAGLGYKMSAAPFHMWAPDVYEGAPILATTFFSIGPKLAGFASAIRFFLTGILSKTSGTVVWPVNWDGLGSFRWVFEGWGNSLGLVLAVMSVVTMTLGNLAALKQENIKRLLAYSSIAHSGYALMGLVLMNAQGIVASCFYLAVYLLMNLGAFLVAIAVHHETGSETVGSYRGLVWRAPLISVAMAVFLFSLTGVPPLAGFIGKVHLFGAVINEAQAAAGVFSKALWLLVVAACLNSVISLYYYARILRAIFLTAPAERAAGFVIAPCHIAPIVLLAIPTFLFGIWWSPLYSFAAQAVLGLL